MNVQKQLVLVLYNIVYMIEKCEIPVPYSVRFSEENGNLGGGFVKKNISKQKGVDFVKIYVFN